MFGVFNAVFVSHVFFVHFVTSGSGWRLFAPRLCREALSRLSQSRVFVHEVPSGCLRPSVLFPKTWAVTFCARLCQSRLFVHEVPSGCSRPSVLFPKAWAVTFCSRNLFLSFLFFSFPFFSFLFFSCWDPFILGGIGRTLQNFLYRSSGATDFPLLESQLFFFSPSFSPQIPEHDQDRQTFSQASC
eukprot:COSAG02_NODE_483_length_21396_cov_20.544801_16_plen_186_part_00